MYRRRTRAPLPGIKCHYCSHLGVGCIQVSDLSGSSRLKLYVCTANRNSFIAVTRVRINRADALCMMGPNRYGIPPYHDLIAGSPTAESPTKTYVVSSDQVVLQSGYQTCQTNL
jgi:hypothetical protein